MREADFDTRILHGCLAGKDNQGRGKKTGSEKKRTIEYA